MATSGSVSGDAKHKKTASEMDDSWEDHRDYMKVKRRKLQNQLESIGETESAIFSGVTIYVNGYTEPDADILKQLVHTHGGDYAYAPSSRVTHTIATNLPTAKIRQLSETSKVCLPEWIVDSVKAKRLLPVDKYRLYNIGTKGQNKLGFAVPSTVPIESCAKGSTKDLTVDLERQSMSSGKSPDGKGKDFVSEFYSHSRLHYLSTWSAELREFTSKTLPQAKRSIPLLPSGESLRRHSTRAICHIDVDSFFVSVSIRDLPHLRGQPIGVTHAKNRPLTAKQGSVSLQDSTSDIASCSYEARDYGVRNGMSVGEATRLCPNLVLVPYEFEKYRQVSQILYETLIRYSHVVQAVSCDEAFVEFTDYARSFKEVDEIVTKLRKEVEEKTGCTVSAGIAHNMLLARLATGKAKPNGQFHLLEEQVSEYLATQPVANLPGIGWSMRCQLETMGTSTCGQLLDVPLNRLKNEFGVKTGEMLYYFARGIDNRDLCTKRERKSLSVEINYGMRFSQLSEAESLLQQLAQELHTRAIDAGVEGTSICLKMKVRKESAPMETKKYLGHGPCDNVSRSCNILIATNASEEIGRIACNLLRQLKPNPVDIRGMGIQLNRLVPVSKGSPSKIGGKSDIRTHMMASPSKTSPRKATAGEIGQKMEGATLSAKMATREKSPILDLPPASQLDQSVLLALPPDLQEEVFDEYSKRRKTDNENTCQSSDVPQEEDCFTTEIRRHPDQFISEVRDNIKAMVRLCPDGPELDDVEVMSQFLLHLLGESLKMVDLALKCMRRTVGNSNCGKWRDEFNNMLSTVQSQVRLKYGGPLDIAPFQ